MIVEYGFTQMSCYIVSNKPNILYPPDLLLGLCKQAYWSSAGLEQVRYVSIKLL